MIDRATALRGAVAMLAVGVLSLLFIASYAGALHEPRPHEVPIAVTAAVPAPIPAQLGASPAFAVDRVADDAAALRRIDEREAYGAVLAGRSGLTVVVAPAASAAIAAILEEELAGRLRESGTEVSVRVVHPLPASDGRGLVAFYLAVGWVVGGYLGATLFGLAFGTNPERPRVLFRLLGLTGLGLFVGIGGALVAGSIAGYDQGFAKLVLFGLLTVLAVGAATIAFQSVLGIAGTGLAILVFVVLGNPSGGGAYAQELLPGFWRAIGPALPPGAATTAVRNAAYFPGASVLVPALVLLAWTAFGAAIALVMGSRGRVLAVDEDEAPLTA